MHIPIENIYYLLTYAWNKLDEKDRVNISVEDTTSYIDLFAKVLINGTRILLKRGLEKNYVTDTIELVGIKGKLEEPAGRPQERPLQIRAYQLGVRRARWLCRP